MQASLPYLKWVDEQSTTLLQRVIKWARINSHSTHLSGLASMLQLLKQEFAPLKGKITTIPLSPQLSVDQWGQPIEIPLGEVLSIRKRPEAPFQILLAGHMDTVYPPLHPFQSVEQINDKHLQGPGVTDMKGGLAILLTALEAFERSPYASQIGWEVLINPDEEIGSPGSTPLFAAAAQKYQLGLIFEPSFADGAFVSHRKGSANYTIVVKGQAAHAGRDFFSGKSAIYAMAHLIRQLEELNSFDRGITVNVGRIEGGNAVNIVPDLAICRLNLRASTQDELIATKMRIQAIVQACQKQFEILFILIEDSFRLPKLLDSSMQMLLNAYQTCAQELDLSFHTKESGGVTDGNTLSAHGLPTLDSVGAIGGNIHTSKEYLLLSSLTERARLTTLFLFKLANQEVQLNQKRLHA